MRPPIDTRLRADGVASCHSRCQSAISGSNVPRTVVTDPGWNTLESLDGVSEQLQNEIAHFFTVYKQLENKKVEVDGWYPCEDALKVIAASRKRFRESSGPGH